MNLILSFKKGLELGLGEAKSEITRETYQYIRASITKGCSLPYCFWGLI